MGNRALRHAAQAGVVSHGSSVMWREGPSLETEVGGDRACIGKTRRSYENVRRNSKYFANGWRAHLADRAPARGIGGQKIVRMSKTTPHLHGLDCMHYRSFPSTLLTPS